MKIILSGILALSAMLAHADIRPPRDRNTPKFDTTIEGDAARNLYDSLSGDSVADLPGDSLRNYSSTYRVFESEDSLARIICRKAVSRSANDRRGVTDYECTVETSKNGRALPRFNPPRRLG